MKTIQLVQNGSLLYPLGVDDLKALRERGYTPGYISESVLSAFERSLFNGIKFERYPVRDILETVFDLFKRSMEQDVQILGPVDWGDEEKYEFGDLRFIMLHRQSAELESAVAAMASGNFNPQPTSQVNVKTARDLVQQKIARLRAHLGRYCFGLQVQAQFKPKVGGYLYQLLLKATPNAGNTLYYGLDTYEEPEIAEICFRNVYRVVIERSMLNQKPMLRIRAQDNMGGQWQGDAGRTYRPEDVDQAKLVKTIQFLTSLLTPGASDG